MNHPDNPNLPLDVLRAHPGLTAELINPEHPAYDAHRAVWNGLVDRRPALVARCASSADVAACINVARTHGLTLSVRCGAHSVAGHGTNDGGLVIDLARMKAIEVDVAARTATAGGGVTWGELDAAPQRHRRAPPGGVFSRTGIAGLTLGGGYGWLRNPFGLACDNLIGAEVVTASGQVIQASDQENPALLWGLRGGGGNFGVVTRFTYRLHNVGPDVMFVFALFDGQAEAMRDGLRFYRDFTRDAPDLASTIAFAGVFPPGAEEYPTIRHGRPFFGIGGLYAGDPEEGRAVLAPILDFATPLVNHSGVVPYVQAQQAFDEDYPDGWRYYWKSLNVLTLDDDVIDVIVEHALRQPCAHSTTDIWHVGGAVAAVPEAATAFHGRHAAFLVNPEANWQNPEADAANITWVREFGAALQPFSDGSRYLNFAGLQEEGQPMMQAAFGPTYERLRALKREWDPTNLFHLNQNIVP